MSKPNVGDQVALKSGMNGRVFGVQETSAGVAVQFSAEGDWHAFDPVDGEAAAEAEEAPAAEPATAEPVAEAPAEEEHAGDGAEH